MSPPALERRVSELTIALEDAIGLGYSQDHVDELRRTIRGLEDAIREETPAWEEAARRRLASCSDPEERPRPRPRGPELPATFASEEARAAAYVTRRGSDLRSLATDAESAIAATERDIAILRRVLEGAVRHRDPEEEILALRRKVAALEDELSTLKQSAGNLRPNGRRVKRSKKLPREVADVRRDIAAGRIDMTDVVRRIDRYRHVLAEVLANDPSARERIGSLIEHIRGLEDVVVRLRSGPDAGVA